ncbi:MAG TPA: hypothetical protein PLN26_08450 [Acidobacteriota bacterium]|nr:hypothetical protein [Acidobacteriota bacterium]HQG91825.1 hypothetical protein [Acidobacteriota bacterium]
MANSIHSAITGRAAECIRTTGRWMAGAAWVVMLVAGGTATRAFGQGGSQPVMSPLQQADRQVVMLGRESRVPWQHLIDPDRAADAVYVDLAGGGQIVAYIQGGLACPGPAWLLGRMEAARGRSKRPGDPSAVTEHQLTVDAWGCVRWTEGPELLTRLADPALPPVDRLDLVNRIGAVGMDAVPVLIAHLGDERPVLWETKLREYGQAPGTPCPAAASDPVAGTVAQPLGQTCENLLYAIITPRGYRSPFEAGAHPPRVGRMFRVADWPAWWGRNHARTLDDVRAALRPVIDRYWQSNGEEQVVR